MCISTFIERDNKQLNRAASKYNKNKPLMHKKNVIVNFKKDAGFVLLLIGKRNMSA